jgi:DUF4097 and DUF4098 domain-containing protein YvlB
MNMNIQQTLLAVIAVLAAVPAMAVQNIDRSQATGATPIVEVNNVQGKVTVTAWDRNEVKVTGTIENDEHKFEFTGDTGKVTIAVRPESKRSSYGRDDDAILEVRVPAGALLRVQTVSADIMATGVRGEQRLEAVSGDITTELFDQPLDVRSISGDVELRGSGGNGKVHAESTSGNVKARGLAGELEATSVSGDVDLQLGVTSGVRLETVSGDLSARLTLAEGGRVDAQSVSGNVSLNFGKPVNGEFEIESFSGDIDNCFGPKASRKSEYAPGQELRFTQGSGNARVSLETLSGDIDLCDH